MTVYADYVRRMRAVPFEKYAAVSSREKLVVYTVSLLRDNQIPLSFNNICIATFKLFPEKFYFSEEYKEFPHIEMLNRTILHLRPIERNYASGSVRSGYMLTPLGEEVARQVKLEIATGESSNSGTTKVMDAHKKTSENDLQKVLQSPIYVEWLENSSVDEMKLWGFFEVTPYTQAAKIKSFVGDTKVYAQSKGDAQVVAFMDYIKDQIG